MKYALIIFTITAIFLIPKTDVSLIESVDRVTPTKISGDTESSALSSVSTGEYKPQGYALASIPDDYEWSVIEDSKYKHVIATIYQGESSFGRHDICRKKGMYNGFGYAEPNPLVHGPTCYESFETVVGLVEQWIDQRVQEGFSLEEMNCYYVRGIRTSNCDTAYKLASNN